MPPDDGGAAVAYVMIRKSNFKEFPCFLAVFVVVSVNGVHDERAKFISGYGECEA